MKDTTRTVSKSGIIHGFPCLELPRGLSGKESTCQCRRHGVQSLVWEDPLEKEMATHSSILLRKNLMDRGAWRATVRGVEKSRTRLSDRTTDFSCLL